MNRISPVLDRLIGIEDPDELMTEITEVVSDTATAPQAGQFFLFSYQPSSSGRYDANPLVAVTDVYSWGFRGTIFITVKHDLIHLQMFQEAHIVSILKRSLIFRLYLLEECV